MKVLRSVSVLLAAVLTPVAVAAFTDNTVYDSSTWGAEDDSDMHWLTKADASFACEENGDCIGDLRGSITYNGGDTCRDPSTSVGYLECEGAYRPNNCSENHSAYLFARVTNNASPTSRFMVQSAVCGNEGGGPL